MAIKILLIILSSLQTSLVYSTTCRDYLNINLNFFLDYKESLDEKTKLISKYASLPKYEFTDKAPFEGFPNPKEGIKVDFVGEGIMGELFVYNNPKTKKSILLKKYDEIADMEKDIRLLNILQFLVQKTGIKNIKTSKYFKLSEIPPFKYNNFFSTENTDIKTIVFNESFINRPDLHSLAIHLPSKQIKILTEYTIKTFNLFFNKLKKQKDKIYPYIINKTSITMRGTEYIPMIIPRIYLTNIKTKEEFTIVPHSKNIIIDKEANICIIDPM